MMPAEEPPVLTGPRRKIATSFHESAHAVSLWFLGGRDLLGSIQVSLDRSCLYLTGAHLSPVPAWAWIVTLFAGNVVKREVLSLPQETDAEVSERLRTALAEARHEEAPFADDAHDSLWMARMLLAAMPEASEDELVAEGQRLHAFTINLVSRREVWRCIEAVATALVERDVLSGLGAREIIESTYLGASPPYAPPPGEPPHVSETRKALTEIFERYQRVAIAFSGGRDSITLAHLCELWFPQVTLLWLNTNRTSPHMVEVVQTYGERFALQEVTAPDLAASWIEHGVPADVVAVDDLHENPRVQAWQACCGRIRGEPLLEAVRTSGFSAVLFGQRRDDRSATVQSLRPHLPMSIEIAMPLFEWSKADVVAYVEANGLVLPEQYAADLDSIECLPCPARMTSRKLQWLRHRFPDDAKLAEDAIRTALRPVIDRALALTELVVGETEMGPEAEFERMAAIDRRPILPDYVAAE